MILRTMVTCSAFDFGELARPGPQRILEADAHVAAHRRRHGRDPHLVAPGAEHRPAIIVAEQAVGGALHVHHVLRMRADAAQDAEHRLHEQRRLHQAALEEVREVVEMRDVVALELEAGVVVRSRSVRMYSMSLKVLRKTRSRVPSRYGCSQSYLNSL